MVQPANSKKIHTKIIKDGGLNLFFNHKDPSLSTVNHYIFYYILYHQVDRWKGRLIVLFPFSLFIAISRMDPCHSIFLHHFGVSYSIFFSISCRTPKWRRNSYPRPACFSDPKTPYFLLFFVPRFGNLGSIERPFTVGAHNVVSLSFARLSFLSAHSLQLMAALIKEIEKCSGH